MVESGYNKTVTIRFYAELNDFLHRDHVQKAVEYRYKGRITVREAIESMGVPHSAVDLVLINGNPAGFSHHLQQGDYISVYPVFETFDISTVNGNRRKPLRITRFVIDAHLGKLARQLRLLGFDSVYYPGIEDDEIIRISLDENRIILTRDRALLKSSKVMHGYYIRATNIRDQLMEVMAKFSLASQLKPFTRCLVCNHLLEDVETSEIRGQIDDDTARIFKKFFRCSGCKKVYWEGSHYERMTEFIKNVSGREGTS